MLGVNDVTDCDVVMLLGDDVTSGHVLTRWGEIELSLMVHLITTNAIYGSCRTKGRVLISFT